MQLVSAVLGKIVNIGVIDAGKGPAVSVPEPVPVIDIADDVEVCVPVSDGLGLRVERRKIHVVGKFVVSHEEGSGYLPSFYRGIFWDLRQPFLEGGNQASDIHVRDMCGGVPDVFNTNAQDDVGGAHIVDERDTWRKVGHFYVGALSNSEMFVRPDRGNPLDNRHCDQGQRGNGEQNGGERGQGVSVLSNVNASAIKKQVEERWRVDARLEMGRTIWISLVCVVTALVTCAIIILRGER